MKRLQDFIINDHGIFGPGTDLVVSLVAVLLITLAISTSSYQQKLLNLIREKKEGQLDIQRIQNNQMQIVNGIAVKYNTTPNKIDENKYGISINSSSQNDIVIENDVTLQRISFGSHILFDPDVAELKHNGELVLEKVGNVFKQKLGVIKETQIQGHADPQRTSKFSSNLELAAHRAIAVFEFFRDELNINPARHIMSATSFGEYKPVQRTYSDLNYNRFRLKQDNDTEEERKLNRRIEIVLIYRQKNKNFR